MFSNGKSILVQPIQKDALILNSIDCRLIDVQQKITDLLSAGYAIYDVASATNNSFNNLIASSSGNRVCVWKGVGSTAYTLYSTELASNGTNVIINATVNNMNQVTAIRDCKLTCSASSGLFVNKAEFYGGDWYIASWTTGSNVKFSNCDVICHSSEIYMPDVNFDYCNVKFKKSGTIAYSTFKENKDTVFVNETTAGSTTSTLTISYAYTTVSDWFTRCTLKDYQNTGTAALSSTALRTINFTGLKLENSNLSMANVYTTEGSKVYYEGQDLVLSGSLTAQAWAQLGTTNISSSSGLYPSIAFNQSGVPYVAFQDNSTSSVGKASCYKYGSTGWVVVGSVGFTSNTMDYVNICISSSNGVYVIGRDNSSKATAYHLTEAASSWSLLGSAGFSTNNVSVLRAAYNVYSLDYSSKTTLPKLLVVTCNTSGSNFIDSYFINTDTTSRTWERYPFWTMTGYGSTFITSDVWMNANRIFGLTSTSGNVRRYDTGSVEGWIQSTSFGSTTISKITTDMTYDGITNNLLYIDNSSKPSLVGINNNSFGTTQFSTGSAQNITFKIINSIPYAAIQDTTTKATCYKFVAANSSWNLVGSAALSTENVTSMQLASWNNIPYLLVQENAAPGIALYKFDEVTSDSNVNYLFENLDADIYDGEKTLDITTIQSTANYIVQNCKVKPIYNIVDTAIGRFIRNQYNIELSPGWSPTVNEMIKETNADTFWVVKRDDMEATLNGKIIKNLKLYDAGLSAYTYNSNDNFIIIANNVTKGNSVFCYYNNKVKGTVFSDWYIDTSYTITDCIILMSVSEISEMQNVVSSTMLTDGPLENGSITLNSYDNEIIV